MVGASNLLFFVPAGVDHTSHLVNMWCEKRQKILVAYEMNEPIHSLSVANANMLFMVGLEYSVQCCSFLEGLKHTIATGLNTKGIHAVSQEKEFCIATPAKQPGNVQITWLSVKVAGEVDLSATIPPPTIVETVNFQAH